MARPMLAKIATKNQNWSCPGLIPSSLQPASPRRGRQQLRTAHGSP